MTFSPELTFIPAKAPYEITDKKAGEIIIESIIGQLNKRRKCDIFILPKLDPFHNERSPEETYCIEAVPIQFFRTEWLENESWPLFKREVDLLFTIMKEHGFVPTMMRRKGGREFHYPGGGCHLHMSADLFQWTPNMENWYDRIKTFHRNLLTDYANRPYIRWLFSNWFADLGSAVMVTDEGLDSFVAGGANVMSHFIAHSTVEARYMGSTKGSYLTFEHRYFSMVENTDELKLIATFAQTWMEKILERQATIDGDYVGKIPFTLTHEQLKDMRNVRKAKVICETFFADLGLQWSDYLPFFKRNYARRIKWGKFV
jgi:hypothetical protein